MKDEKQDEDESSHYFMPSNEYETEDVETPPENIKVENVNGLDDLKNQLSDRGINVEVCVPEVLAMVHDFIDS